MVGFKAVPSGDVGTNAWSERREDKIAQLKTQGLSEVDAKALASGRYTFYQVRATACVRDSGKQALLLEWSCSLTKHTAKVAYDAALLPVSWVSC